MAPMVVDADKVRAFETPVAFEAWLAANPRVTVHFTPTSGSWLNLVEVWFGIIERQAIHRGTFRSVADLNAKIWTVPGLVDSWGKS